MKKSFIALFLCLLLSFLTQDSVYAGEYNKGDEFKDMDSVCLRVNVKRIYTFNAKRVRQIALDILDKKATLLHIKENDPNILHININIDKREVVYHGSISVRLIRPVYLQDKKTQINAIVWEDGINFLIGDNRSTFEYIKRNLDLLLGKFARDYYLGLKDMKKKQK